MITRLIRPSKKTEVMLKVQYRKTDAYHPGGLSEPAWDLMYDMLADEGITDAQDRIRRGENGKPYIDGNPVFFNLSHSGEYVLGITADREAGCDIQKVKTCRGSVVNRFFHSDEKSYIEAAADSAERDRRYTRVWALRESLVKCTGEGLRRDMKSFHFSFRDGKPLLHLSAESEDEKECPEYAFSEPEIDGYQCACCIKKELT